MFHQAVDAAYQYQYHAYIHRYEESRDRPGAYFGFRATPVEDTRQTDENDDDSKLEGKGRYCQVTSHILLSLR